MSGGFSAPFQTCPKQKARLALLSQKCGREGRGQGWDAWGQGVTGCEPRCSSPRVSLAFLVYRRSYVEAEGQGRMGQMRFIFLFLFLFFKKGFWKLPRDTSSYISLAKILPQIHVQLEKSVRNGVPPGGPCTPCLQQPCCTGQEHRTPKTPRALCPVRSLPFPSRST